MVMNYHWISDQAKLNNCYVYLDKGTNDKADYHTKHHLPNYHKQVRSTYTLKGLNLQKNKDQHLPARVCCSYDTIIEQSEQQTNFGTNLNGRCDSGFLNNNRYISFGLN